MQKKVFVTGGTGFLGAYIIRKLVEDGYHVKALRRSKRLPDYIQREIFDKVEWIDGDILDVVSLEDGMTESDIVIHSAGIVSFQKKNREEMYKVNVEGTANVVNIALEKGIKRFVHISSIAALGRKTDGGHVNEEKKWEDNKINTHYSKSKYRAELEVWRGMSEGLNAVILNPSTILGFGDWHSGSSAIFRNVYNEFKWYSPGLNGFVDVQDVARATVLLMESDITEERYIINSDNWYFKKLVHTMSDCFGRKKATRQTTPAIVAIAWRLEKIKSFFTGKNPLLTRESAKVAHSKTYFDNEKFLRTFPQFQYTSLHDSIRHACNQYAAKYEAGKSA